jgi:hypothetical protein
MSDDFKYQCKRRSARQHSVMEEAIVNPQGFLGAGSGGGPGDGNVASYTDGVYCVVTPQTILHAVGAEGASQGSAESDPLTPMIALLAGEKSAPDGLLYARGTQGVRITSGPPHQPNMENDEINGVEIQTGDTQELSIRRGTQPGDQGIYMTKQYIVVDGGFGDVTILSDSTISFQIGGGTSMITLTHDGIVLKGPIIQIN